MSVVSMDTDSLDKLSEDNNSSSLETSSNKSYNKNDKRTLLERQLEINMTPKMTLLENSSPENASPNTSRYGRARKQKTMADFYPIDVALQMKRMSKSPPKSPKKNVVKSPSKSPVVKKQLIVASPITRKEDSTQKVVETLNKSSEQNNVEEKPVVEQKILHLPWNERLDKVPLKVYTRKDLIQKKPNNNEETGSLMRSIFSYAPSFYDQLNHTSPEKDKQINTVNTSTPIILKKSLSLKKSPKSVNESPKIVKESPKTVKESPKTVKESPKIVKDSPKTVKESPKIVKDSPKTVKKSPTDKPTPTKKSLSLKKSPVSVKESPKEGKTQTARKTATPSFNWKKNILSNSNDVNSKNTIQNNVESAKTVDNDISLNKTDDSLLKSPTTIQSDDVNRSNLNESQLDVSSANVTSDETLDNTVDESMEALEQDEADSFWKEGELLWAKVGSHPFWPCLITRDPFSLRYVMKKKIGRSVVPVELYHVTYFADSGRRSWIPSNCLIKFEGLQQFEKMKSELTPEVKKKDPKYYARFNIKENKKSKWMCGVNEAEMLLNRPSELRVEFFIQQLEQSIEKLKSERKAKAEKRSSFDTFLNMMKEDEAKTESHTASESIPTSEVLPCADEGLDSCIDSLVSKTDNAKNKVQTHMDRWLLKAKNPVLVNGSDSNNVENVNHESAEKKKMQRRKSVAALNSKDSSSSGPSHSNVRQRRMSVAPRLLSEDVSSNKTPKRRRQSVSCPNIPSTSKDVAIIQDDSEHIESKPPKVTRRRKSIVNESLQNDLSNIESNSSVDTNVSRVNRRRKSIANESLQNDSSSVESTSTEESKPPKVTRRRKSIVNEFLQNDSSNIESNSSMDTNVSRVNRRRKSIANEPLQNDSLNVESTSTEESKPPKVTRRRKTILNESLTNDSTNVENDLSIDECVSAESKIPKLTNRRKSCANETFAGNQNEEDFNEPSANIETQNDSSKVECSSLLDENVPTVPKMTRRRKSVSNNLLVAKNNEDDKIESQIDPSKTENESLMNGDSTESKVPKVTRRRKSVVLNQSLQNESLNMANDSSLSENIASESKISKPNRRRKSMFHDSSIVDNDEEKSETTSRILRRRKTIDYRISKLSDEFEESKNDNGESIIENKEEKMDIDIVNDKLPVESPLEENNEVKNEAEESVVEEYLDDEKDNQIVYDKRNKLYDNPDFMEFFEMKRDAVMDENSDLTEEDVLSYLYRTWQYSESKKSDEMKSADDYCLVKGMTDEVAAVNEVVKKPRKRINKEVAICDDIDEKQSSSSSPVPKEKSLRKKTIKSYFTNESDSENDDVDVDSTPNEPSKKSEKICETKDSNQQKTEMKMPKMDLLQPVKIVDFEAEIKENTIDYYMESLKRIKPSLFKGLVKEKVCYICEKPTGLTKCKGTCGESYHIACVQNQKSQKEPVIEEVKKRGRKKKGRKKLNASGSDNTMDESGLDINDSVIDENDLSAAGIIKPVTGDCDLDERFEEQTMTITTNACDFESQAEKQMQEMLGNASINELLDISTTSIDLENEWTGVKAGECVIVNAPEPKKKIQEKSKNASESTAEFKCNECVNQEVPLCFVCKLKVSPKTNMEERQRCNVMHCNKHYHMECLQPWPQTKYTSTCPGKYQKKISMSNEAMSCPRHVCHTCVSDDPRGSRTRFSGDKLARCVRCPATYHCFAKCVPAGTKILTGSQIVCPRHNDNKVTKVPYHVNTSWCFICTKGGSLICCETCPMSFHAECLAISPPEGGYICEDCETGRLPLYEEIVWVKLGHYRWWPALILHPSDIPPNIAALSHATNQFAVRFFGDYDHYWVNSGRVFLYQEGDTGYASSRKSAVDSTFLTAVKQASQAYDILKNMRQNDNEREELVSSLLPPPYVKLKVNRPVGGAVQNYKNDKTSASRCECDPNSENPCAPDSNCINRMLHMECSPSVCPAGELCQNQCFEKRQYPSLVPNKAEHRGWGLKTNSDIKMGSFVIEYVGEIIDDTEFQKRMRRKRETRDENYYFLTIDKDRTIDAGPKGNVARFMNHSCEPNCETQKWTVNGDTRVGLFALQDIPAGSEVTFNYNLMCADDDKKKCMCGAKKCAGYIGAKVKQDEPTPKNPKKSNSKNNKPGRKSLDSSMKQKGGKGGPTPKKRKKKSMPAEIEKKSIEKQIEADGIEKDWQEINQAAALVEETNSSNIILDSSNVQNDVIENGDHFVKENGYEIKDLRNGNLEDSSLENSRVSKRSLSPVDSVSKHKRARSNSVYPKESSKHLMDRSKRFTIDGDAGDIAPKKAKRGRPRLSLVQNEI